MVAGVEDAAEEKVVQALRFFLAKPSMHYVQPQGNGQAGVLEPGLPQVQHLGEPLGTIGDLAFVDEHTGVHVALGHGIHDLIEGYDLG